MDRKPDIRVDGMGRNLIPPPKVIPIQGLIISKPESGIFFKNGNTDIGFQRESKFHLAPTTELIRLQNQIKVDSEVAEEMFRKMIYIIEKEYAEVLRRVRDGNTLTILLPFEEEQAELKDCQEYGNEGYIDGLADAVEQGMLKAALQDQISDFPNLDVKHGVPKSIANKLLPSVLNKDADNYIFWQSTELLEDHLLGIPMSPLSWLKFFFQKKFNRSLDESLGEKNIEELLVEMRNEGMVLFYEEPESKKRYVMSPRMVENRRKTLKSDVQELLDKYGGEIRLSSFEGIYKKKFKVKWNRHLCCLKDLDDLCSVLNLVVGAGKSGEEVIKDVINSGEEEVINSGAGNSGEEVIKASKIYNLRKRKK
ncbi:hypothetical protein Tco_0071583 [Tanacetum coccineum]